MYLREWLESARHISSLYFDKNRWTLPTFQLPALTSQTFLGFL